MAAEWTRGDEWGTGKAKGASSGRTGPFAVSGGAGRPGAGTLKNPGPRSPAAPVKRYPAPLELGADISAAPTDYVRGLLQGVAPERQAARLQTELDGLTQESLRLRKKTRIAARMERMNSGMNSSL